CSAAAIRRLFQTALCELAQPGRMSEAGPGLFWKSDFNFATPELARRKNCGSGIIVEFEHGLEDYIAALAKVQKILTPVLNPASASRTVALVAGEPGYAHHGRMSMRNG